MPSGTTFANDKAIWRDNTWHPQISGTVPIGFGPTGLMVNGSIWAIDCVTGAGYCKKTNGFDAYKDQVEQLGEAQYNMSVGFGDSEKPSVLRSPHGLKKQASHLAIGIHKIKKMYLVISMSGDI